MVNIILHTLITQTDISDGNIILHTLIIQTEYLMVMLYYTYNTNRISDGHILHTLITQKNI